MTVYERIRELRISQKMTQSDLAQKMGYKDGSMITKIESGKVDISQKKLIAFAEVLGTSPAYLMGWIDSPVPSVSERLTIDEHHLVTAYRSLPTAGKEYLLQQSEIATITFGGKTDSLPSSSSLTGGDAL